MSLVDPLAINFFRGNHKLIGGDAVTANTIAVADMKDSSLDPVQGNFKKDSKAVAVGIKESASMLAAKSMPVCTV
jgi:hypothetical protein